jgi:putative transposase
VNIRGQQHYLWRAVDQDGVPRRMVTDKLRSYAAAHRTIMPSVAHDTSQYANNWAEVSHEPTRERGMRRFKSMAQAQRFLSVHGITQNLFRVGRHLLRAANYRILRARAFVVWTVETCA